MANFQFQAYRLIVVYQIILKNGNYELHFVSYNDTDNDGEFEFNAMLDVESAAGVDLGNINISSETNVDIAVTVTGTL